MIDELCLTVQLLLCATKTDAVLFILYSVLLAMEVLPSEKSDVTFLNFNQDGRWGFSAKVI